MTEAGYPIDGACQCGGVTCQRLEPPLAVVACHWRECRKLSTSAFRITAAVRADALRVDGKLHQFGRLADSGNKNYGKFCRGCGNRIYHFNPDGREMINLDGHTGRPGVDRTDDTPVGQPKAGVVAHSRGHHPVLRTAGMTKTHQGQRSGQLQWMHGNHTSTPQSSPS